MLLETTVAQVSSGGYLSQHGQHYFCGVLHGLAQLVMAQSLLGLSQAVGSQAEDSAQWPDLSSGKGTRRLF